MDLKKPKNEKELETELQKVMLYFFGDQWESFYCNEIVDLIMTYIITRGLKLK